MSRNESSSSRGKSSYKSNTDDISSIDNTINDPENIDGGSDELRAQFSSTTFTTPLHRKPQASPLLSSTPPAVSKALVKAYPYLLIVNKILSIVTWTNEDYWLNVIIMSLYSMIVLYFESLVVWFGHLIIVGILSSYAILNHKIIEEASLYPTLDDVVQALTASCIKADMLLNPITSLSLTAYDIKRLLFTTLFLTPIYLIITFFLIKPRIILLITGLFLLSYHSSYARVTRRILWKMKLARLICFYLTGLDFSKAKNHSLFAAAFAKVQKNSGFDNLTRNTNTNSKPIRFTYVIYENQRRWLGIGWTSNLLSYERSAWTDEFLNESSSIEEFKLPNASDSNNPYDNKLNGAHWRWVDKTWRLDLTNDGAITLPNSKRSKTTANPGNDEGFIYYDNTWKKPTTEDTYSKYTRRRRWIRTAELVFDDSPAAAAAPTVEDEQPAPPIVDDVKATGSLISESSARKIKSLRFADEEEHNSQPLTEDIADLSSEATMDSDDVSTIDQDKSKSQTTTTTSGSDSNGGIVPETSVSPDKKRD
ncbi:uncharacterized protein J8A68_003055 [[Candida] subhashii]|uniref:Peroxin/Ferlin domain-containing protein n=1 Tax=[Candida] subhashii TaxID=561895 RepID=A0A8J5QJQ7_9ASCO|nr:uncharacterized protein J8A68_003055 [[Candida] subhashii]KAG7663403.1 hypothetical protein J8A68_003055 [[Candida] subhashii]